MDSEWYTIKDLKLMGLIPTSKDTCSAKDQDIVIKKTFELLENGESKIVLHQQLKKVILVLGDTGNGKSKFTHWIAGDDRKLISRKIEEDTDEYVIEDINGPSRSIINSETIFPQLVVDDKTNVAFCDCPGFNDTRDASNEIATTFFIKKMLDHAESVKLIFVINYPAVRKGVDRHDFMKLVRHIADFIKNIEKFQSSIALVVTKVDNLFVKQGNDFILVDNKSVITAVANFLKQVRQDLAEKLQNGSSKERQLHKVAMKFISILLFREREQYTRIGIFRRPDKSGPLSEISLLQEEKESMKKLIHEQIIFTDKVNDDFGYTISEDCKNKINYFVEEINRSVWSSLFQIKEEIKDCYSKILSRLRIIVLSFVDEKFPSADLHEARDLSTNLKHGLSSILGLIKDVESVTNPESLAQKINAVIDNLGIDISKNVLLDMENKGKYFNFLQIVSDRKLSIRPWVDLLKEVGVCLSNIEKKLQEDIVSVHHEVCKELEYDLQHIAKELREQFDDKMKLLDMKMALGELINYYDAILEMTEEIKKNATSITKILKIARHATRNIGINLPEHGVLSVLQKEKNFTFLSNISETELHFESSEWTYPFGTIVKHLNESIIWYKFLDGLYATFSEYAIQKDREKYNVVTIEDWGETGKPQGIVVTERNFLQFLRNVANCNNAEYDDGVKNIMLTELRLDELNQILNLTLKHRIDIQYAQTSIFIRADYISIKEMLSQLDNGHNLLADLKSGIYKFLQIFAFRKVFIDEDMSLPGMELHIISPKWEVVGNRKISLDGADGEPHSKLKAEDGVDLGSDGEDGEPGLPGKPGGIFFGIGAEFINGANLTVSVNGGNGGPGQDAGNGQEGVKGKGVEQLTNDDLPEDEGGITRIKGFPCEKLSGQDSSNKFVHALRFVGSVFAQNPLYKIVSSHLAGNTLYKIIGEPGQLGGNGGNGGKGGRAGNPGNVRISCLKENSKIMVCANKGRDGKDGKGGNFGKDGMNGHIKFALLRNSPADTPILPLPLPGLPLPIPATQVPVPGVQAPIPVLAVPLPFLRRPEWVHQVDVPGGEVSTGVRGTCGLNSRGLQIPELPEAVSHPLNSINDYKRYATQNLTSRFKKALLLDFVALLSDSDELKKS